MSKPIVKRNQKILDQLLGKNSQDITKPKKTTNKPHTQVDTHCFFSFRERPQTEASREKMAYALIEWLETASDPLEISEFYTSKGLSYKNYNELCNACPLLKDAHLYVMERLGIKRERAALENRLDVPTLHKTLGAYSQVWKQEQERLAALNKKDDTKALTKEIQDAVASVMRDFNE